MYNVLAEDVTFVSKYVHSRRLLKWHTHSAILSKSCFPTQTQRDVSTDDLLVVWNNGELETLCHYQGRVDTCANRTSWWGVSWPGLRTLQKSALRARPRASALRADLRRCIAGLLVPYPISPTHWTRSPSRFQPLESIYYIVCMYVSQGNCSLLFRLGQTKCAVIITTYIVLVSFRPGQKSTCFSVINTLDLQS